MRAEIAHETRVNKQYLRNVERAKMVESMQAKKQERKRKHSGGEGGDESAEPLKVEVRRQFRQHKAKGRTAPNMGEDASAKESSEKVKRLLGKVF